LPCCFDCFNILNSLQSLSSSSINCLFCCCITLFCVWTPVTCEDLARKSSVPTRRALLVKPTLLGWCNSPVVHHDRTVQHLDVLSLAVF
jgi:hypothetical protein